MTSQERRPFKVCQADRSNLKGFVAGNLNELKSKACEIFGVPSGRICLEQDGTEIEDEEYFQFLKPETKIMVLSEGERWQSGEEDDDRLSQEGDEVKEGLELDVTDSGKTFPHHLITRMKLDPAFFVSFKDEDLETVIKADTRDLSMLLHRPLSKARHYQDASQCELDRRLRMKEANDLLKLLSEATQKNNRVYDPEVQGDRKRKKV